MKNFLKTTKFEKINCWQSSACTNVQIDDIISISAKLTCHTNQFCIFLFHTTFSCPFFPFSLYGCLKGSTFWTYKVSMPKKPHFFRKVEKTERMNPFQTPHHIFFSRISFLKVSTIYKSVAHGCVNNGKKLNGIKKKRPL